MKLDGKFYSYKINDGQGYNVDLKKCIEDTCQYCIDNTLLNTKEKINKPIMMLGKIQSGKTRAFTGLIALAFDNDFDIVFILTKNSKALVQQTVSRMKQEFGPFISKRTVVVADIMKANSKISGYQLERKNIIVAKKEKNNIDKLIEFIKNYSINESKKCLIIDDEADTTGIGYNKIKGMDEFTLRAVSAKVNEMRGNLDGCVFVEVTATPYALYLQPEFAENNLLKPIKPQETILVPHGKEYIGGDYYFISGKDDDHPASLIFQAMSQEEGDLVADQKRKGKKSKIEDRRSFKEEEILIREDKLPTFKNGIINFIVGSIALREIYKEDECYSYVIHTATQKNSHISLQSITETFLLQIKERNKITLPIIERLLENSYIDIKESVEVYGYVMPDFEIIQEHFFHYIDNGYYSIDVVNADQDVEVLLDELTGELNLRTPCSIFVGGQVLDRGVTIPNMIGFYYGRNPKTMQQDTVLQHSRMFGYRKRILPVTRFYTTNRIHSNMEKITEIDLALREDIDKGKQGNGVYFITNQHQDKMFGSGAIKPCSPDKIKASDIILLKPHNRILPVGFTPVVKADFTKANQKIEKIIDDSKEYFTKTLCMDAVFDLIGNAYSTIIRDDDSSRFIEMSEFITSLKYMLKNNQDVTIVVKRNKNNNKFRQSGRIEDSPAQGEQELKLAQELAIDKPVIILLSENGADESWNFRSFWWPILVAPKNVPNTIYAAKIASEKVNIS